MFFCTLKFWLFTEFSIMLNLQIRYQSKMHTKAGWLSLVLAPACNPTNWHLTLILDIQNLWHCLFTGISHFFKPMQEVSIFSKGWSLICNIITLNKYSCNIVNCRVHLQMEINWKQQNELMFYSLSLFCRRMNECTF
jgi:hypothetical protein